MSLLLKEQNTLHEWDHGIFNYMHIEWDDLTMYNNRQRYGLRGSKLNRLNFLKPEPNRTMKPLKPQFRGSVSVFNLGQNSNFKISKISLF